MQNPKSQDIWFLMFISAISAYLICDSRGCNFKLALSEVRNLNTIITQELTFLLKPCHAQRISKALDIGSVFFH
jgi:hypothetical protein